jgi:mRNA-degrading endonuclease RelE of RelBE toxin-antitoxin system
MKIDYVKSFLKSYNKLDKKIQLKFDKKVEIFQETPFEKFLNNHPLN